VFALLPIPPTFFGWLLWLALILFARFVALPLTSPRLGLWALWALWTLWTLWTLWLSLSWSRLALLDAVFLGKLPAFRGELG